MVSVSVIQIVLLHKDMIDPRANTESPIQGMELEPGPARSLYAELSWNDYYCQFIAKLHLPSSYVLLVYVIVHIIMMLC